jgi:hypothetical protein
LKRKKIRNGNVDSITTEWSLTDQEIRTVENFNNIPKDEITDVMNFLEQLARLEITIERWGKR